jgi:hypothetical protein
LILARKKVWGSQCLTIVCRGTQRDSIGEKEKDGKGNSVWPWKELSVLESELGGVGREVVWCLGKRPGGSNRRKRWRKRPWRVKEETDQEKQSRTLEGLVTKQKMLLIAQCLIWVWHTQGFECYLGDCLSLEWHGDMDSDARELVTQPSLITVYTVCRWWIINQKRSAKITLESSYRSLLSYTVCGRIFMRLRLKYGPLYSHFKAVQTPSHYSRIRHCPENLDKVDVTPSPAGH